MSIIRLKCTRTATQPSRGRDETHKAWWSRWLEHDSVVENGLFPYTTREFIRSAFVSYIFLFCTCIQFSKPITQHSIFFLMIIPSSYPPPELKHRSCSAVSSPAVAIDLPFLFFHYLFFWEKQTLKCQRESINVWVIQSFKGLRKARSLGLRMLCLSLLMPWFWLDFNRHDSYGHRRQIWHLICLLIA